MTVNQLFRRMVRRSPLHVEVWADSARTCLSYRSRAANPAGSPLIMAGNLARLLDLQKPWAADRPSDIHSVCLNRPIWKSGAGKLSRTRVRLRELFRALSDGPFRNENVSGKFEPSAQFPHLFQGEIALSCH